MNFQLLLQKEEGGIFLFALIAVRQSVTTERHEHYKNDYVWCMYFA